MKVNLFNFISSLNTNQSIKNLLYIYVKYLLLLLTNRRTSSLLLHHAAVVPFVNRWLLYYLRESEGEYELMARMISKHITLSIAGFTQFFFRISSLKKKTIVQRWPRSCQFSFSKIVFRSNSI